MNARHLFLVLQINGRHRLRGRDVERLTYYTLFVIDLASRRVQIVGLTPHTDDFMRQVGCALTTAEEGVLIGHRVLIPLTAEKISRRFGGRQVQTPGIFLEESPESV